MKEQLKGVREVKYYHSPPVQEWNDPERFCYLTNTIVEQLFLNPSLSFSRFCWGSLLYELYHNNREAYESGYGNGDVLLSIVFLQDYLTSFGLLLHTEIEAIKAGEPIQQIEPARKFVSYDELVELSNTWRADGLIVSLAHGSLDPPHFGHSRMALQAYKYSNVVVGGFDPNGLIKHLKGTDRPRFPQLYWRMWEVAGGMPTVDYVVALPIGPQDWQTPEKLDARFDEIYQELGIRMLLAGQDHPLLDKYQTQMAKHDGWVVCGDMESQRWSSTRMMSHLTDATISERTLLGYDRLCDEANRKRAEIQRSISPQAWCDIVKAMVT